MSSREVGQTRAASKSSFISDRMAMGQAAAALQLTGERGPLS